MYFLLIKRSQKVVYDRPRVRHRIKLLLNFRRATKCAADILVELVLSVNGEVTEALRKTGMAGDEEEEKNRLID